MSLCRESRNPNSVCRTQTFHSEKFKLLFRHEDVLVLVVTFEHDGNVNGTIVVFLSLQTEGFSVLPERLIPLQALKALQNACAGSPAALKASNSMTDSH